MSMDENKLLVRRYVEEVVNTGNVDDLAGVTGVPMFVIGDQVLTGMQDRGTLEAVIEEELARQERRDLAQYPSI